MPSSDVVEDEVSPAKAKKPTTPRRSPAIRRARNATPARKVSANKAGTPKSAPTGAKAGMKKPEPTLLGDFLLGRQSVNRARRASLDIVKPEMKRTAVSNLQPPKGVSARVKQWQKANAAAILEDAAEPASEPDEVFVKVDEESVNEEDRRRIKFRKQQKKSAAPRKSIEAEATPTPETDRSSPKKRIVSDTHWMISKERKNSRRSPKSPHDIFPVGSKLPKDFVNKNSSTPPLEKKINDWAKRTANEKESPQPTQTKKAPNINPANGEIVTPGTKAVGGDVILPLEKKIGDWARHIVNEEERARPIRTKKVPKVDSADEECLPLKAKHDGVDDGVRVTALPKKLSDDEDIIRSIGDNRRQKAVGYEAEGYHTPRRKSGKLKVLSLKPVEPCGISTSTTILKEEEQGIKTPQIPTTPSRPPRHRPHQQDSISSDILDEIPVGYSAFSVLEMPMGSQSRTKRPIKPQRQGSLSAVPKVLKRVYTEGLKIVHDTVDPPRTGVNQPPSIESWLKGTSDPFVDQEPALEDIVDMADQNHRCRAYETKGVPLRNDFPSIQSENKTSKQWQNTILPDRQSLNQETAVLAEDVECSINRRKSTDSIALVPKAAPPLTSALTRSPATRNSSIPGSLKQSPPKNMLSVTIEEKLEQNAQESPTMLENDVSNSKAQEQVVKIDEKCAPRQTSRRLIHAVNETKQAASLPRSPALLNISKFDRINCPTTYSDRNFGRWDVPPTGLHRLSTIASVETFNSSSSTTETCSELSQTTVTQTTLTQKTSTTSTTSTTSNTSHTSYTGEAKSSISRQPSNHSGLKRRLTKHSDLLSVLSLPDTSVPGRSKSLISARSVRTNRSRLDRATIPDLLRELADDEVKYMRELKTLVDGVIPVLLSCVLSKAESAVAAGLFDPASYAQSDGSITKPIVDMGVALERLKISHKNIPVRDPGMLIHWALRTHKVYEDYIAAWRMGFRDVIVNLAPAMQLDVPEDSSSLDEMPRNTDGDVLNENGQRVDVAFLLKRPLVRVKYLAKMIMGFSKLMPSEHINSANEKFQDLLSKTRRRMREEEARLVDQAANNTDATRARDPMTLAPMEDVKIDSTRQVNAKDFFDFGLLHSTGQRIDCRVEILLRDKLYDDSDGGDLLICEVDTMSRWLLFPPIELDRISARRGNSSEELTVMIREVPGSQEWHEIFRLTSTDNETATEWLQMLGSTPTPPNLEQAETPKPLTLPLTDPTVSSDRPTKGQNIPEVLRKSLAGYIDVPIGERRNISGDIQQSRSHTKEQQRSASSNASRLVPPFQATQEEPSVLESKLRDLNDAMEHAGKLSGSWGTGASAKRYHARHNSESSTVPFSKLSAGYKDTDLELKPTHISSSFNKQYPLDDKDTSTDLHRPSLQPTGRLSPSKNRKASQSETHRDKNSSPLKESMRLDGLLDKDSSDAITRNPKTIGDEPPPPPLHRTPNAETTKKSPLLATLTSTFKNRRSSSPLKHEYQPSHTSSTSSTSDESESEDSGYSSDSSEEELEALDSSTQFRDPGECTNKVISPGSNYNLPSGSLVPSNSASQAPYRGVPQQSNVQKVKLIAAISCWSEKGYWDDLHPQDCCIVVSPGLIEAFPKSFSPMGTDENEHVMASGSCLMDPSTDAGTKRPLVALELTPIVPLRQSNAVDIEIRSPPTARSTLKCTHTVRFRSRNLQDCSALYSAIHKARLENPVYIKLDQERILNSYGKQLNHESADSNRRRSWFGRSKSYRASARAPSVTVSDNSTNSFASAISRLRNIGGIGGFNIAKSSVDTSSKAPAATNSGPTSLYTDSSYSGTSRATPPGTPSSPSVAMTGTSNVASFGTSDLKIRLYHLETSSKWNELGNAFLTITQPPRGMRQASSLYHGIEKRIIVTKRPGPKRGFNLRDQRPGSPKGEGPDPEHVLLDVVLGAQCFSRLGVVGIAMNVWEDIVGDNGQIGTVGAIGGVSGRTRKWLFQCASAAEATWIFAHVGGGGR